MFRKITTLLVVFILPQFLNAQSNLDKDSLVKSLLSDQTTPDVDQGVQLIQTGNFSEANKFFSSEISKDESDRKAYFRRGVANWALSDTLSACRDWSAVLALGDTEMFNILDGHCHGAMIITDYTLSSKEYHKIFGQSKGADASAQQNAKTVVEVMPAFPGGEQKLFEYLSTNLKRPPGKLRGTVYVNFLISPKGKVLFPYVSRGVGNAFDKEAVRLVRNMPAWSPGKQKGKAVFVRSNLPIRF